MSELTNLFDSRFIPQLVENPVYNIIRKVNEDTETYICNRLLELNIDKDILINQTQEIKRLYAVIEEYERLEEQGLLLRLPCKVNDTVYVLKFEGVWRIIPHQVKTLGYIVQLIENEAIGDFVFLTQEEAEQVLAEMKQSHAEAIMDERNGR